MGTWYVGGIPYSSDDICHFGRIGMKWGKNIFGEIVKAGGRVGSRASDLAGKAASGVSSAAKSAGRAVANGYNAGKEFVTGKQAKNNLKTAQKRYDEDRQRLNQMKRDSANETRTTSNKMQSSRRSESRAKENLNTANANMNKALYRQQEQFGRLQDASKEARNAREAGKYNRDNMTDFYNRAAQYARDKANSTTEAISAKQRGVERNTADYYQKLADENKALANQIRREQQEDIHRAENREIVEKAKLDKADREYFDAEDAQRQAMKDSRNASKERKKLEDSYDNEWWENRDVQRTKDYFDEKASSSTMRNLAEAYRDYNNTVAGRIDNISKKVKEDSGKAVKNIKDWGSGAVSKGSEFVSGIRNKVSDKVKEVKNNPDYLRTVNKFNTQKTIVKEKARDAINNAKVVATNAKAKGAAKINSIKEKGKNAIKAGKGLIDAIRYNKKKGGKKLIKGTAQPKKKNKG